MTISARDRKLLWTRAGDECAFPGCSQTLTLSSGTGDSVLGEEAHIIPKSPAGPRGEFVARSEELDSCPNLVLLCPTHHTIVDQQSALFPPETLYQMKAAHERGVRERLRSDDLAASMIFDVPCIGRINHVWRFGEAVFAACSYGTPPVQEASGRWKGAGVSFFYMGVGSPPIELHDSSEAQPDLEFWMGGDGLHIQVSTFLFDECRFTPLVEMVFNSDSGSPIRAVRRLVDGSEAGASNLPELLAELKRCKTDDVQSGKLLGRIFKAGLDDPTGVLSVFDTVLDAGFLGGERSLGLIMRRELELIRDASTV